MSRVRDLLRRTPRADPVPERDPEAPLRIAALTFVRDEGRMLPLWIKYYGAQLGTENLYVVDDNSVDGSTDDLPCDVLRVPPVREGRFESTRMAFLAGQSAALLAFYDCVVFCDADEFIVPDPEVYAGLREFIERQGPDVAAVAAMGLNVVHAVDFEEALDLSRPVLGQRRLVKFLPLMCKPAIKFAASPWYAASHGLRSPYRVDPDLWMFHLKFADRELLREVADRRQAAVAEDGRSHNTNWRRGGDELVALLDELNQGAAEPVSYPEFAPPEGEALAALVVEVPGEGWRAPRGSQVRMMRKRPLQRVPDRFHGIV